MANMSIKSVRGDVMSNSKGLCLTAIIITFVSYCAERGFEILVDSSRTTSLIAAIVFTVLFGVMFFITSRIEDTFYGILAAVIGYKMMPPVVYPLFSTTAEGSVLFVIVKAVAIVLFAILIFKMFNKQSQQDSIQVLPILALMFVVPFFNELGDNLATGLQAIFITRLYSYGAEALCYLLASFVIWMIAYKSNYPSAKFVCYFQYLALALNICRRVAAIAVNIMAGTHISASYYCWIALYVVILVGFVVLQKKAKAKA